jgi:poly(3-hydroxybutyrate) depolymerase
MTSPPSLLTLADYPMDDPRVSMITGATPWLSSRLDPRFAYCLYVPVDYRGRGPRLPLVVVVHGTERATERYRDAFAEFCEFHQCAVLAPLFPITLDDPSSVDHYKRLEHEGVRYDLILLDMVDEACHMWRLNPSRFLLSGFSGGGQFAHRFWYLHPDRVEAVSIGAPGRITMPDEDLVWPAGWATTQDLFGHRPAIDLLREVPVQLVVGAQDTDVAALAAVEGGNPASTLNRIERMRRFHHALTELGVGAELTVVPGAAHDGLAVMEPVQRFLARYLAIHAPDTHVDQLR